MRLLKEVHIADVHFSSFNPAEQYKLLSDQFLSVVERIPDLDVISIDGDLFDHKVMTNSDGTMYACMFMERLVQIARMKQSVIVLIHGTYSHDSNQLKLFSHYLGDNTVDFRIVNQIQFEYIKGAKILCIPELYGVDESIYRHYLFDSGLYDSCFMHGTFKGAVYGDNPGQSRLFTIDDFCKCKGPIISGHVHNGGCFNGYFYYCGAPYCWKFGEETDKGFLLVAHNLDTGLHYVHFQKIYGPVYKTIHLDELVSTDPKVIIDYITSLKQNEGIDFIKVKFRVPVEGAIKTVVNNYYRNDKNTFVEFPTIEETQTMNKSTTYDKYDYFYDTHTSPLYKFVRFVNESEGEQIISVDELKSLLESDLI